VNFSASSASPLLSALSRTVDRLLARAFPPRLPSSAAALLTAISSDSWPVAIRMTLTAAPITSAGRFSPLGPFGIVAIDPERLS
jgi:hypothetical protein